MSKIKVIANKRSAYTRTSIDALELDRLYVCERLFIYMVTSGMPEEFVKLCRNMIIHMLIFQKDPKELEKLIRKADEEISPCGDMLLAGLKH